MSIKPIVSMLVLLWGTYQIGNDRAVVKVTLVSNLGGLPLNDNLVNSQAILTNKENRQLVFKSQGSLMFREVPYGKYELTVSPGVGSGFDSNRRDVLINQENSLVVVGLDVATADTTSSRAVVGKIKGPVDGFTWVKLVSLYSTTVREAAVDRDGAFRFNEVRFGTYLFVTIRNGQTCDSRAIDVVFAPADFTLECK